DALMQVKTGPVVALNRAVAVALSRSATGSAEGLSALYGLESDPALKGYHLLYASIGELERRRGELTKAETYFEKACALARTEAERRWLTRRLALVRLV